MNTSDANANSLDRKKKKKKTHIQYTRNNFTILKICKNYSTVFPYFIKQSGNLEKHLTTCFFKKAFEAPWFRIRMKSSVTLGVRSSNMSVLHAIRKISEKTDP
eukprot:TCONS_00038745-protein